MKFGLLGALGGAGQAMGQMADQTLREQAESKRLASIEQYRVAAEDRAHQREVGKLTERRGLLSQALETLPGDASDLDRSRRLSEVGLLDEAKTYADLYKSKDLSEHRSATREAQAERDAARIDVARERLAAQQASGTKPLDIERKADLYVKEGLYPDRRSALESIRADERRGSSDHVPPVAKNLKWLETAGPAEIHAFVESEAGKMVGQILRENPLEQFSKDLFAQARERVMQAYGIGGLPSGGQTGGAQSPPAKIDLNQFFKK
jgi:hypothetical protein